MAFLHSFFDESGKFNDHKMIAFCGVAAPSAKLERFNEAWSSLLRRNQMPFLHTVRALKPNVALSPILRKQTIPERIESLKPFADCIVENLDLGIAMAVDVEGYTKWEPGAKKRVGGKDDPTYIAFLRVGLMLEEYASRDDDQITITCDDDLGTAWNFYQLYRRVKIISPKAREKYMAITFADDKKYPALQAADFLAALVRLEAYNQFIHRPYDFRPLFKYLTDPRGVHSINWNVAYADRQVMDRLGARLNRS